MARMEKEEQDEEEREARHTAIVNDEMNQVRVLIRSRKCTLNYANSIKRLSMGSSLVSQIVKGYFIKIHFLHRYAIFVSPDITRQRGA